MFLYRESLGDFLFLWAYGLSNSQKIVFLQFLKNKIVMKNMVITLMGLFVCGWAQAAVGDTFETGGLTYVVKSKGMVGVSSVESNVTTCTIPANVTYEGTSYKVVAIEEDAFYWSNVVELVLPETVESIKAGAFRSSPLAEINLPTSLKEIGARAFYNTEITSISLPEGITRLEDGTFQQCEELLTITLPSTLESIGGGVFYKCGFSEIDIPNSCMEIGAYAFENCKQLQQVKLPANLLELKEGTFYGCNQLVDIQIPTTVTTIETAVFQNVGMKSLHLPASVEVIQSNAFNGAPIETVTVAAENPAFVVEDNVLYTKDHRFLYLYPRTGAPTTYTLHEDCVAVYGGAFYGTEVKEVIFPDGFLGIDTYAFCLSTLERINLPASVELLYDQAFAGTNLKEFNLPAGVTTLSDALFADCKQLTTVTLHDKVTEVGNRVFYYCSSLSTIYCLGTTPPEFAPWDTYTNPFFYVNYDNVDIVCPTGTLSTYQLSEWGDFFTNIREADLSAVASVNGNKMWAVETLSGKLIVKGVAGAVVKLVSANGAVIAEQQADSDVLTFSALPKGIYVVSVISNGVMQSQKVLL